MAPQFSQLPAQVSPPLSAAPPRSPCHGARGTGGECGTPAGSRNIPLAMGLSGLAVVIPRRVMSPSIERRTPALLDV